MAAHLRGTEAHVLLSAIQSNLRQFQHAVGSEVDIMAVVKANGYGHGALPVAKACLEAGAAWLGVAVAEEAIELRDSGIEEPILILGASNAEQVELALKYNLDLTIFDQRAFEMAMAVGKRWDKKPRVHVKIDTGMGRVGISPETVLSEWVPRLMQKGVIWQGLMSHLADSDGIEEDYTRQQLRRFLDVIESIRASGTPLPPKLHLANSAATLRYPGTHFNMVRIGIGLYGAMFYPGAPPLHPALTLTSRVTYVKKVPPGFSVGYGRTFVTSEESGLATVAIGYADGYRRALSNRAEVLIGGVRCPVVGRVSMDQITCRVPNGHSVEVGDAVTLIGTQGHETLGIEEIAGWAETISYEILTGISSRVPRRYR